jgi:hypothetical protein
VDKNSKKIICTNFTNGKTHDFKLFKNSRVHFKTSTKSLVDSGYIGIKKTDANSELPKKKSKKNPLTKEDKKYNQKISSERVLNENVIGCIKRFHIIADKYRNRRKRFGLRFNLIAGIYNYELEN